MSTDASFTPATYNAKVTHPLQSYEWGEFRKKTGVEVIRGDDFELTIHPIPHTKWTIGYLPKGNMPSLSLIEELRTIGKVHNCISIQLEPNVISTEETKKEIERPELGLVPAAHPLFTKYTFQLDLTQSEDELLRKMHPKARYNIRVAQKHNVIVTEDNSEDAFEAFWRLTEETTKRQKFYAHTKRYHKLQWETFAHTPMPHTLSSHILLAKLGNEVLTAWVLFIFNDMLYYPYGASSTTHKEAMANNLIMWEAIKFGREHTLKRFDMWGALGPDPDPKDPWIGFHTFKKRYGPEHIEFIGSYDLVLNPMAYQFYKAADKLRWLYLRLRK